MTDTEAQNGSEATQAAPQSTESATPDPRESKAFKAVTGQLAERDKQIEALTKKLDKLGAAEEARTMAANEEAGDYAKNLEAQQAKFKELTAEFEAFRATAERQATESRIDAALAAHVPSPKARKVLMAEYLEQDEPGELDAWIENAKADEANAPFFAGSHAGKAGVPAPRSQGASTAGTNNNKSREELLAAGDKEAMRAVFNETLGLESS